MKKNSDLQFNYLEHGIYVKSWKLIYVNLVLVLLLLAGDQFSFADSHVRKKIVPGVMHHSVYIDSGPWSINILEVDLQENSSLNLKTYKAEEQLAAREKLSEMSRKLAISGYEVIGGINGDFFSSEGIQIGVQVVDGLIISEPCDRSVFGFTVNRRPFIDIVDYEGHILTENGNSHKVHTINRAREKDFLVLYNSFIGRSTQTNKWGTEIAVEVMGQTTINDTMIGVVREMETRKGNMSIEENELILSGHDAGHIFLLNNVEDDDTVKIHLKLHPITERIDQAIGGMPRLLRDGRVVLSDKIESIPENFAMTKHPRSAVGFSADSTTIFLVTVDGRQAGFSEGMTLVELATYLLTIDVYDALNLDGGGSTTMVIGDRVVNSPSDNTGERAVANGLFIISGDHDN